MKCSDCSACKKGFFKSQPTKFVCVGTKAPFLVDDISSYCKIYQYDNEEYGEIISATEARNKTEENIKTHSQEQMKDIEDKIHEAIESREFYCFYSGTIHSSNIDRLINLGYKIDPVDTLSGKFNKISWFRKEK